jgi:hypothetical protein
VESENDHRVTGRKSMSRPKTTRGRTYHLLGKRTTLTAQAQDVGPAGTVMGGWAVLNKIVVNHLPRHPHGQRGAANLC